MKNYRLIIINIQKSQYKINKALKYKKIVYIKNTFNIKYITNIVKRIKKDQKVIKNIQNKKVKIFLAGYKGFIIKNIKKK